MSGFETNLRTGIAAALNTAAIGVWREASAYAAGETAIVFGTFPQDPARAVCLSLYGVGDEPSLSDSTIGLQVRTRWDGQDPRLVDDLAALVLDYLHGKTDWTLSTGVHVVQCLRKSWVPLGQDTNGRWERSDNYYLDVWQPSANRT